jgi:hypothetical protein
MRQSPASGDGRAVSRAVVGGDLRCGMSLRGDTSKRDTCLTGFVGDEAVGGCSDVGYHCRCLWCPFPLQLMQVREQRCARSSLSGGTRSNVVGSVLAVASVVRTLVLGVSSRRGHQYVGEVSMCDNPSHINNCSL